MLAFSWERYQVTVAHKYVTSEWELYLDAALAHME